MIFLSLGRIENAFSVGVCICYVLAHLFVVMAVGADQKPFFQD